MCTGGQPHLAVGTRRTTNRQGAQHLFTEIVFDLDTRRIVSYKLKPWADDS